MIIYHILYKEQEQDRIYQADNFTALTPEEALAQWRIKYPDTIFCVIYPLGLTLLTPPKDKEYEQEIKV